MQRLAVGIAVCALFVAAWVARGGPGGPSGPDAERPSGPAASPAPSPAAPAEDDGDPFEGPVDLVVLASADTRGETVPCG